MTLQRDFNEVRGGSCNRYNFRARRRAEMLCSFAPPISSLLDVGCREGEALRVFADRKIPRLCGLDITPEFLEEAALYADTVEGDVENLPFPDVSFEWIFCSHTLEHARSLPAAWSELLRVASFGLFIVLPLETRDDFDINPAHFTFSPSVKGWLDLLPAPDPWDLTYLRSEGDVVLVWTRLTS